MGRLRGSPLLFSRSDGGGFDELNLMRLTVGAWLAEGAAARVRVLAPSSSSAVCLARFLDGALLGAALAFFLGFGAGGGGGGGEAASCFAAGFDPGSLIVSLFLGPEAEAEADVVVVVVAGAGGGGAGEARAGGGVCEALPNFSFSVGRGVDMFAM